MIKKNINKIKILIKGKPCIHDLIIMSIFSFLQKKIISVVIT